MSKKRQDKRSKVKPFIKVVNYNHLMPTRYTLELEGLKGVVTNETFTEVSQREEAKKTVKKTLEERYSSGKNRWFFTPLRKKPIRPGDVSITNKWQGSRCVEYEKRRKYFIGQGGVQTAFYRKSQPSHMSTIALCQNTMSVHCGSCLAPCICTSSETACVKSFVSRTTCT